MILVHPVEMGCMRDGDQCIIDHAHDDTELITPGFILKKLDFFVGRLLISLIYFLRSSLIVSWIL